MEENLYLTSDVYEQKKIFRNLQNSNVIATDLINIRQKLIEKKLDPYAIAVLEKKRKEKEEEERQAYFKKKQLLLKHQTFSPDKYSRKGTNISPVKGHAVTTTFRGNTKTLSSLQNNKNTANNNNVKKQPTNISNDPLLEKKENKIDCNIPT